MFKKITAAFRRDVVLTVSLVLAAASCFIAPPGREYLSYIDFNTLIILFCLMLIVEGLRRQNFLQYVAGRVLNKVGTVRGLVCTLVFLCFLSSMFITNDVSLITFVPFGIMVLEMADQRERVCYTITLMTIAANLGSMFTPIGNPQNLYLFSLAGLDIPSFLLLTGPYTVGAAVLLLAAIFFGYKQSQLYIEVGKSAPLNKKAIAFFGVLFVLCVLTVAGFIPHEALFVVVTLALLWRSRALFAGVDYSLIFTFIFFFIFVGNLKHLTAVEHWIAGMMAGHDRLVGVLVSQVISNVPAAMLLSGYSGNLRELIVGVNLGGLGTLIASMASLISYKQVANRYPQEKQKYLLLFTILNVAFLVLLYWI